MKGDENMRCYFVTLKSGVSFRVYSDKVQREYYDCTKSCSIEFYHKGTVACSIKENLIETIAYIPFFSMETVIYKNGGFCEV